MSSRLLAQSALRRQLSAIHRQRVVLPSVQQVRFQSPSAAAVATSPRRRRDHNNSLNDSHHSNRRDHKNHTNHSNGLYPNRDGGSRRPRRDHNGNVVRRPNGTPRAYQKREEEPVDSDEQSSSRRIAQSTQKIQAIQADVSSLMRTYEEMLFQGEEESSTEGGSKSGAGDTQELFLQGQSLHDKYSDNISEITEASSSVPWSKVEATERIFRELCGGMQKLIFSSATSRGSAQSNDAEMHLRTLTQLRSDRAALVNHLVAAKQGQDASNSYGGVASKVISWINKVFVLPPDGDDDKKKALSVIAHSDMAYAPRKRHFKDVLSNLFFQTNYMEADTQVLMERADRMAALMELVPEGMELHTRSVSMVLKAHGNVGRLDYANKAEEILRTYEPDVPSYDLFSTVLLGYGHAAQRTDQRMLRSKAAKQAERLVLRLWDSSPSRADGKSNTLSQSQYIAKCRHYAAAVKALSSAGNQAVPEACERAENLAIKCMGAKRVSAILTTNDATADGQSKASGDAIGELSPNEMLLLHHLLGLYARQGDSTRFQKARAILRCMELQHKVRRKNKPERSAHRRNGEESVDQEDTPELLPSLETYRSMVAGTRSYAFTLLNKNKRDQGTQRGGPKQSASGEMFEVAEYATNLIDDMAALSISPDKDFYARVLKVWHVMAHVEAGERAEAILSRMQMRALYDPTFDDAIVGSTYENVIRCWEFSSHPQAAERVDKLLRLMEAQSGMFSMAIDKDDSSSNEESDEEDVPKDKPIYESVYNSKVRPGIALYNKGLRICSKTENDADKAMEIALDLYQRILIAGLDPNRTTLMWLFRCIKEHSPQGSDRRVEIMRQILAMSGGSLNVMGVHELMRSDKDLYDDLMKGLFAVEEIESIEAAST
jgi:hypothetical protein